MPTALKFSLTVLFLATLGLLNAAPTQPHIVFILADDLGWTDIGFNANANNLHNDNTSQYHLTPSINRLADMGMTFTRAYAAPNCAPTRAAFHTGMAASKHGVTSVFDRGGFKTNGVELPNNVVEMAASFTTVAETLRSAGYATGHFGKWHIGLYNGPNAVQKQGFDINVGGAGNQHSSLTSGNQFHADSNGQWTNGAAAPKTSEILPRIIGDPANPQLLPKWTRSPDEHMSDALTAEAISWMTAEVAANPNTPVFLYLAHHATHTPIDPKTGDVTFISNNATGSDTRHNSQNYAALLYGMDRSVGDMLDYLENNNDDQGNPLIDNTVFVFMSDNGAADTSLSKGSNLPLRGAKGGQFEGGVRVPAFISTPAMRAAGHSGSATTQPIHVKDFHSTLATLAGATAPAGLDGVDFSQVLIDPTNTFTRDIFEWWLQQRVTVGEGHATLHRGDMKLIWYPFESFNADITERFDLFDVVNDLSETNDLSGDPAHRATLEAMAISIGDKLELDGAALPFVEGSSPVQNVPLPNTYFAYDDSAQVDLSGSVLIDVLANDFDPNSEIDAATVQVVSGASGGSTSINPVTGAITYTHGGGNANPDSFTYTFQTTGAETSNEATVNLTVQLGQVVWDGETSSDLGVDTNWSPDTTPSSTADFLVDSNSNFGGTGDWLMTLGSQQDYGSLEFSAAGTGTNAGRFGIRAGGSFGRFKMHGDIVFSGSEITQDITLQGSTSRNLAWAGMGDSTYSIINNTTATVTFGAANRFAFAAWNGSSAILQFGGTGDFIIGPTAEFDDTNNTSPSRLSRLYTAPDFGGTVTIQDGTTVYLNNDLRTRGGTIKIEGTDTIGDSVGLSYNSDNGGTSELDVRGLVDTVDVLASFSGVGEHRLTVDAGTNLIASDLRNAGGIDIDIQGWVEGQSSVIFTNLGGTFYDSNAIADGAVIQNLTLNGGPAYLAQVPDVNGDTVDDWAISAVGNLSAFETWASGLGDASFAGAPDGDGIANGLKWTLGGVAGIATTESALVDSTLDAVTGLTLVFDRVDESVGEVTLEVEYGSDLSGFPSGSFDVDTDQSPNADGVTLSVTDNGASDELEVNIPASNASADGELFGRIKVTENE